MEQFNDDVDAVVASIVLLDIVVFRPAIVNCLAALRPGGAFFFLLEHPFTDVAGRGALPFPVHDYFTERELPRAQGVNFHRTLESYADAIADAGGSSSGSRSRAWRRRRRSDAPSIPGQIQSRHSS